MTTMLDEAERHLTRTGLIHLPGAVLYASHETLRPGQVYLLGLNPGGAEGATLRDNLAAARRGNNSYLDEQWSPGGRLQPRGQSTLQRRVQGLCRQMGIETRATPASNLASARSTAVNTHADYAGAVAACAPVHKLFMDAIQPRLVMTFGSLDHFAKSVEILSVESTNVRHAGWRAHRGRAIAFGHEVRFANIPHMSLWASDKREDVVEWTLQPFKAGLA